MGQAPSSFRPTTTKSKTIVRATGAASLLNYFKVKPPVASTSKIAVAVTIEPVVSMISASVSVSVSVQSKFFNNNVNSNINNKATSVGIDVKGTGKARHVVIDDEEEDDVVIDDEEEDDEQEEEFPDDEGIDYDQLDGLMDETTIDDDTMNIVDIGMIEEDDDDDISPRPERSRKRTNSHGKSISSFADISSPVTTPRAPKRSRISIPSLLEEESEEEVKGVKEMKRGISTDDGGVSSPAPSLPDPWSSPSHSQSRSNSPSDSIQHPIHPIDSIAAINSVDPINPNHLVNSIDTVNAVNAVHAVHAVEGEDDRDDEGRIEMSSSDPISSSSQGSMRAKDDDDEATPRAIKAKRRSKPTSSDVPSSSGSVGSKRRKPIVVLSNEEIEREASAAIVTAGWKARFMLPPTSSSISVPRVSLAAVDRLSSFVVRRSSFVVAVS
jgi:hypothetical protein